MTIWQKFNLCQLYGWLEDITGYKRFKQSFIEVGRKNAKSQMEAGVALYEISVMATRNEENYEYYTAGTKRDQSKIILNEAKLMLNKSPLNLFLKHQGCCNTLKNWKLHKGIVERGWPEWRWNQSGRTDFG